MKQKNDPALYRRMCEPFASAEEANAALTAFYDELRALREKHRIADVHVTWSVNVVFPDGETPSIGGAHIGDPAKAESMAAWAFGFETADTRAQIERIAESGRKRARS